METRIMNRLDLDMPLLGMGLMRLPMKDDVIDEEQSIRMVDAFYNAGVRYFDTAYVYGKEGASERFVKAGLTSRYAREDFYLASKMPLFGDTYERRDAIFAESCERMGVDYIDFYLLHALNAERWEKVKATGVDIWQRQLKAEGKIRYCGFSFHDSPEALRKILSDRPDWDFVQIQFNYYDWYNDCAKELYDILSERGIPIVVMEPVRGGGLVELGADVREIFEKAEPGSTNARWAMRWVGSHPAVNVVLSGVSTIEQAEENCRVFAPLVPLSDAEEATVKQVLDTINSRPSIPCTGCKYCSECPMNIPIHAIFNAANAYTQMYNSGLPIWRYFTEIDESRRATACIGCRACVEKCPQHIEIPEQLQSCHELFMRLKAEAEAGK